MIEEYLEAGTRRCKRSTIEIVRLEAQIKDYRTAGNDVANPRLASEWKQT